MLIKLALASVGLLVCASSAESRRKQNEEEGWGTQTPPWTPPGYSDSKVTMEEKDDAGQEMRSWVCTWFSEAGQEGVFGELGPQSYS